MTDSHKRTSTGIPADELRLTRVAPYPPKREDS